MVKNYLNILKVTFCKQYVEPKDYKAIFMLNLSKHEISTALSKEVMKNEDFFAFNLSDVFTMLINIKIPTIVGINIYIYQCVYEHDKYIFELSMKKV